MKKPEKFTKEEAKKVDTAIKRMLFYSEEEWDAIQNPELMNEKLFNQCILTSIRINDYDIYMKLSQSFPEYFDTMFAKIEARFPKSDSELPETSQIHTDAAAEKLLAAIKKTNGHSCSSE